VSHQDLTWRMTLFVVVVVVVLVLMAAAAAAATASLQSHRILMGITVDAEEDATMKDKPIMPWKVDKLGAVSGLSVGEGVRGGRGSSWDILLSTIFFFFFYIFFCIPVDKENGRSSPRRYSWRSSSLT
jgi:preprotein translocase subunit SecG